MFHFFSKNKKKVIDEKVKDLNQPLDNNKLSFSLQKNISLMKNLFSDNDTIIYRCFQNNESRAFQYCIIYTNGLVDSFTINENIIKPLMLAKAVSPSQDLMDTLIGRVVLIDDIQKTNQLKDIVESATYGDTVLFADGCDSALILNTKDFKVRAIEEPDSEKILRGPREGFCESLIVNLSLLRRKLRTNDLKMKYQCFGRRSNTQACICYLNSIVNKKILNELYKRLEKLDIDGVLDTNYITEFIKDSPYSLYNTIGYTERPDVVAAKLLEGRVALFLDGTPVVLTLPYLFIENFQSNEDYYLNFYYTTFSRGLRILGFLLTIAVPALYIAVEAYHHEMLPTPLLINFASERRSVPLPAAMEAFLMLIVYEILRETGIRMPSNVGQALSIVGALVIGQAAVEAKLVSAPMIIVVALTAITALLIPKLNAPSIYLRFFLLTMASILGFYGLILGFAILLTQILNLRSFGIAQITPTAKLQYQEIKDTVIRAPWWQMVTRPNLTVKDNVRLKNQGGKNHD